MSAPSNTTALTHAELAACKTKELPGPIAKQTASKTMEQTELKVLDTQLTPSQISGLCALIHLAHRETTTVRYQMDEWGFSDIPHQLCEQIDELTDEDQLDLVIKMSSILLDNWRST